MKNKRRLPALFNNLCVLCLLVVLVGCVPATPTPPTDIPTAPPTVTETPTPIEPPTPTESPTETPVPPELVCETLEAPQTQHLTKENIMERQMIVTGPVQNINQVIEQVMEETAPEAEAVLLQRCNLSFLSTLSFDAVSPPKIQGKEEVNWFFNPEHRSSLSMQLYEVRGDDVIIEEIISAVNALGNPPSELFVYADPNYLTGGSQSSDPCYLPNSGGGGGGGRPYGEYGIPTPGISPSIEVQFVSQWALRGQGIVLPNSSSYSGNGIRVGVFDTAPLELVDWDPFPALPSDLDFGSISNFVTEPERPLHAEFLDGSDHGLFAAGLIHAVAPKSEIHIIRVLNDEGCGTSSDLARGLVEFMNQMGATSEKNNLHNVVINLSLGMNKPDETPDGTLPEDFVAFETAIFEAQRLGAVIVAAAGNESDNTTVLNMVLPAAYDVVYGVAATNDRRIRSCYSNMGDIAAPGGDGGVDPTDESETCVSRSDTWEAPEAPSLPALCTNMAGCRYGVISLSLRATGTPGYIFWSGTSFSTPLVTGLAALTLEKARGNPITADCLIGKGLMSRPADPHLRVGRINVTRSLASTCP